MTEQLGFHDLKEENVDSENISDCSEETLDDMLNIIENECSEISSGNNKKDIQSQWNDLFKPRTIPNCIKHGEQCKEYTVNKPGKNQGRSSARGRSFPIQFFQQMIFKAIAVVRYSFTGNLGHQRAGGDVEDAQFLGS